MKVRIKIKMAAVAIVVLAVIGVFHPALRAQESSRSVWDGVYTEEQAKRGLELYAQECSTCHAADLSGNGEAAALTGPGFLANWSGLTVGDLSERGADLDAAEQKGKLNRQQIVDILSYIIKYNNFPAGKNRTRSETRSAQADSNRSDQTQVQVCIQLRAAACLFQPGHTLDLHTPSESQAAGAKCAASRHALLLEEGRVDRTHLIPILDVGEHDGAFDHVIH